MAMPQRQPAPDEEPQKAARKKPKNQVDTGSLVGVLNHWIRRKILRHTNVTGVLFSASDLRDVFKLSLSTVSYHVSELAAAKVITEVDNRQVRGALEHIYMCNVTDSLIVHAVLKETEQQDIKAEAKYRKKRREKKKADGE